jgi:hypothetical protein
MLLRILKSNTLISSLLIPVIGILFWMQSFQSPGLIDINLANGAMPFYILFYKLFREQDFWQVFFAFVLVLVNSFFISQLGSNFLFQRNRSYLPGIVYLITVSSITRLHNLLPVHFATLFVLITLYFIIDTYHKPNEITFTFNASFFLSIASLFYFPVVTLFPLVWISIFVLQKSDNWRLLVIPVLGFGTPWIFLWTFSFLTDTSTALWQNLTTMLWDYHNSYLLEPYFLLLSGVVSIVTILGSISVIGVYHRIKVSSRKYFVIFYWMLGILLASALGLITIGIEIVALSTIPVSYFITHFLVMGQKSIWKEVIAWVYLATMVFALYFYK